MQVSLDKSRVIELHVSLTVLLARHPSILITSKRNSASLNVKYKYVSPLSSFVSPPATRSRLHLGDLVKTKPKFPQLYVHDALVKGSSRSFIPSGDNLPIARFKLRSIILPFYHSI